MDSIDEMIAEVGVPLHRMGINEFALSKVDALSVLDHLKGTNRAVLGGDVYTCRQDKLSMNYDSWYSEREPEESDKDYGARSIREAERYICEYPGENRYFVLVVGP